MSTPSVFRREAVAHHEAAHAVFAIELGREVTRVSVRETIGMAGHCTLVDLPRTTQEAQESWKREIAISLAGPAAEELFRGEFNARGARGDFNAATELAEKMFATAGEQSAWLDAEYDRVMCLAADPARWQAIAAVAQELLVYGELEDYQIQTILKQVAEYRRTELAAATA